MAESASKPAAIFAVAEPSSAWAARSDGRCVMHTLAVPYVRPSLKQLSPRLVEHLDSLRAGARHELLEPTGCRHHDQREGIGVEWYGGEIQQQPWSVPSERDGRRPVEHPTQRSREQLVERVQHDGELVGRVLARAVEAVEHLIRRRSDQRSDIGQGRFGHVRRLHELFDGGEECRVLDLLERAVEDRRGERCQHLRLTEHTTLFRFVFGGRARSQGIHPCTATRRQADDVQPEVLRQRPILALGVGHRDPSSR